VVDVVEWKAEIDSVIAKNRDDFFQRCVKKRRIRREDQEGRGIYMNVGRREERVKMHW
jgi:hypothetical protein